MSESERKQNKVTKTAGLTFNVNAVRSKLKDYHESRGVTNPTYGGGQIAMTVVLEKFCVMVFKDCASQTPKDKSGGKQVNVNDLQRIVLIHPELKNYFVVPMSLYNPDQICKDLLPVDPSEIDLVMDKVDKELIFSPKAKNLMYFLISQVFQDLASTSTRLMKFAKKHKFKGTCVSYAVQQCFAEAIAKDFCDEIALVMKTFNEEVDVMSGDVTVKATPAAKTGNDADTSNEKAAKAKEGKKKAEKKDEKKDAADKPSKEKEPAPKKPGAKNAAKNAAKNKAEKIEVDDDSDSSGSSDSSSDSDNDSKNDKPAAKDSAKASEKPKAPAGKQASASGVGGKPSGKPVKSK